MAIDYGFLGSPIGLMGASILANKGNIGQGLLQGFTMNQAYRNNALRNQMLKMQLEQAQIAAARQKQQQQAIGAPERQIQPWETMGMAPLRVGNKAFSNVPQMNMNPGQTQATGMFSQDPQEVARATRRAALLGSNPVEAMAALEKREQSNQMFPLQLKLAQANLRKANAPTEQDTKYTYGNASLPNKAGITLARKSNRGEVEVKVDGGWQPAPPFTQLFSMQNQGTKEELGLPGLTPSQQGQEVLSQRDLEQGIQTGDKLKEYLEKVTTPAMASARSTVAGVIGAAGDVLDADALHDAADAISPPALESFKTEAILWVRGQRKLIDDSRLSDQDAQALNEAFGVLRSARSKKQMINAIETVQEVMRRAKETRFGGEQKKPEPVGTGPWQDGGDGFEYRPTNDPNIWDKRPKGQAQ